MGVLKIINFLIILYIFYAIISYLNKRKVSKIISPLTVFSIIIFFSLKIHYLMNLTSTEGIGHDNNVAMFIFDDEMRGWTFDLAYTTARSAEFFMYLMITIYIISLIIEQFKEYKTNHR